MNSDGTILRLADALAEALDERNDVQRALDETREDLEEVRHTASMLSDAYCDLMDSVDFEAMNIGAAVLGALPEGTHIAVDEVCAYSSIGKAHITYRVVDRDRPSDDGEVS